jgi:hypothetical protein
MGQRNGDCPMFADALLQFLITEARCQRANTVRGSTILLDKGSI